MADNTMIRVRPVSRFLRTQNDIRVSKGGIILPNPNGAIITNDKGHNLHSVQHNEYIAEVMWTPETIERQFMVQKSGVKETDRIIIKDDSGFFIAREGKAPFKVGDLLIVNPGALMGALFEDGTIMVHVDNIVAKKGLDGKATPLFDYALCEMHIFSRESVEKNAMKIAERHSVVLSLPIDKTWISVNPSIEEYDVVFHGHFNRFLSFDDKEYIAVLMEDMMAIVGKTNKAAHAMKLNEWYMKHRSGKKWNG